METLNKFAGIMAVVAIVIAIIGWGLPRIHAIDASFGGMTNYDGITIVPVQTTDGFKLGTNGTLVQAFKTGSCTIWSSATTITATSSALVVCQSATDGTLASGLTGVTADSICQVRHATSTNTTFGGLGIGGVSASSTAGSIGLQVENFTGTTFTWSLAASSSSQWNYSCFDPA